jgi:hypothetical protein
MKGSGNYQRTVNYLKNLLFSLAVRWVQLFQIIGAIQYYLSEGGRYDTFSER